MRICKEINCKVGIRGKGRYIIKCIVFMYRFGGLCLPIRVSLSVLAFQYRGMNGSRVETIQSSKETQRRKRFFIVARTEIKNRNSATSSIQNSTLRRLTSLSDRVFGSSVIRSWCYLSEIGLIDEDDSVYSSSLLGSRPSSSLDLRLLLKRAHRPA
jgi:hypothetical protein